jgi:hypothetical protein
MWVPQKKASKISLWNVMLCTLVEAIAVQRKVNDAVGTNY